MVNDVHVFKLRRNRKEEAVVITSTNTGHEHRTRTQDTNTGQFELINGNPLCNSNIFKRRVLGTFNFSRD